MSAKPIPPHSKFLLLTCLYFSQGLPYGFFSEVLPVVMREQNASLPDIGLTSLLALPWMLKFLWAPLVDKYGSARIGQRKSWLIVLQGLAILGFFCLGLADDDPGYRLLLYGYLVANLIAATQDIATDGLAVTLLNDNERGLGNGLQVAGYRLGMILGGGLILVMLGSVPRPYVFFCMSAVLLLMSWPLLRHREAQPVRDLAQSGSWGLLSGFLKRPGVLRWLFLIGFYKFGDAMTSQMLKPFLVDLGWDKVQIGWFNTLTSAGALVGALLGGWLVWSWGRYRAVFLFGLIQTLGVLGYFLICRGMLSPDWLFGIGLLEHVTGSMATVALFTAMMDVCTLESASTDYTVQASMVVLATGLAKGLSGFSAKALGYQGNFLVSTLLCLLGALLFGLIFRRQSRSKSAFVLRPSP